MQIVRAKGEAQRKSETFTGEVYAEPVLPPADGIIVNVVTFTPGARTHWHIHEGGQLLIVLSGAGFVQAEGASAQPIRGGDTVWIPPDEKHWHGAGAKSVLVHTAVSLGDTRWLEELSGDLYAIAVEATASA